MSSGSFLFASQVPSRRVGTTINYNNTFKAQSVLLPGCALCNCYPEQIQIYIIAWSKDNVSLRYLVAWGRDRTSDRAAAACEGFWLGRRGAAAAGRGVVVPGVVLVHDPGERNISADGFGSFYFIFLGPKKNPRSEKGTNGQILWHDSSLIWDIQKIVGTKKVQLCSSELA